VTVQSRPAPEIRRPPRRWSWRGVILATVLVGGLGLATLTVTTVGTTPEQWRVLVISGLALGSLYALLAAGFGLVYTVAGVFNLAHGEVFVAGMMTSQFVAVAAWESGFMERNPAAALLLCVVVAVVIATGVSVLLELAVFRPLRHRQAISQISLIAAIGAALVISNSVQLLLGETQKRYPRPDFAGEVWNVLGVPVLGYQIVVVGAAGVALVGLWLVVHRTRLGRAMRAVAEDGEQAVLLGVNLDRVRAWSFVLAGVLAGVAAVAFALIVVYVYWYVGLSLGFKGLTASLFGGAGSVVGSWLGGMVVGMADSLGRHLLLAGVGIPGASQFRDAITFAILIFILVVRPGGLFGRELR